MSHRAANETARGALAAAGAYTLWGLMPVYFKAVQAAPPLEIVAHRIIWSALLLTFGLALFGCLERVRAAMRHPRLCMTLLVTAVLVTCNWLVFVWAVSNNRILDASLGYYINPLVSIALGALFLGERLRRVQIVAVILAVAGVANELIVLGHLPWVSLVLALTFGFYGLLRKRAAVDATSGLLIETAYLSPLALCWLTWQGSQEQLIFASPESGMLTVLLIAAGAVTTLPLLLFAHGAKRLPLATLGFIQYLAPSINLALAIVVYGEEMSATKLISFVLIWSGLLVYSVELALYLRRRPSVQSTAKTTGRDGG